MVQLLGPIPLPTEVDARFKEVPKGRGHAEKGDMLFTETMLSPAQRAAYSAQALAVVNHCLNRSYGMKDIADPQTMHDGVPLREFYRNVWKVILAQHKGSNMHSESLMQLVGQPINPIPSTERIAERTTAFPQR